MKDNLQELMELLARTLFVNIFVRLWGGLGTKSVELKLTLGKDTRLFLTNMPLR